MCRLKMTQYGISYRCPWSLEQQKLGISGNHFIPFVSFVKFVTVTDLFDGKAYIVYSYYLQRELYVKINTRKYNINWNTKCRICQHYQHRQLCVITEKLDCLAKMTHFTVLRLSKCRSTLSYISAWCVYIKKYISISVNVCLILYLFNEWDPLSVWWNSMSPHKDIVQVISLADALSEPVITLKAILCKRYYHSTHSVVVLTRCLCKVFCTQIVQKCYWW